MKDGGALLVLIERQVNKGNLKVDLEIEVRREIGTENKKHEKGREGNE